MPLTIADPAFLSRLIQIRGVVELKDPDGNNVGRIQTTWPASFPSEVRFFFIEQVTEPTLLAAFSEVGDPVEVTDPQGNQIGRFERTWFGCPPPGYKIPLSDEEMDRRQQHRSGRSLAEILADLERKNRAT
jgi:hypothetical protein